MRARERGERAVAAVVAWLGAPRPSGSVADLAVLAEGIGRAVGARGCWIKVADRWHGWGEDGPGWAVSVDHGGEVQGVLSLVPADAGPVAALTAVLGPVVAEARLRAEADAARRAGDTAARDLADLRWRAAAEMDSERRGLERDLHDGAQHHLVSLKLVAALVEHSLEAGEPERAAAVLANLESKLDTAEELVARTAAGVLPLALVSDGLAAALTAELAQHDHVALDIGPGVPRCAPVVESAVYFICMEAVNNAHKHAPGAAITVTLHAVPGGLRFAVSDDGPGFADLPPGSGLHHLGTRATAVGGTARIQSAPGRGTTVSGTVPSA
ncbi:sensor histidine kinase [Actinokineospora sp. 24-640]